MNARLGEIALLLADGEADDFGAERLGGVFGKAAPAAADLQQLLARPQIDGLGKPAVLVVLRLPSGLAVSSSNSADE